MNRPDAIKKQIQDLEFTGPEEMHTRILQDVIRAHKQARQEASVPNESRPRRIPMLTTFKTAVAAVIIIAITLGVINLPGDNGNQVYARVAAQLRDARTLTYTLTVITPIPLQWKVFYKEPGLMRMTDLQGTTIADLLQGRMIMLHPAKKQYDQADLQDLSEQQVQQMLNVVQRFADLPQRASEMLGEQEFDDRLLQGFRVFEEGQFLDVWIDPQTEQLVRIESGFIRDPEAKAVLTNIRFDQVLEDSLFDLTPPPDYEPTQRQIDVSQPGVQDLVALLQYWADLTTDHSFPPVLEPSKLTSAMMSLVREGRVRDDNEFNMDEIQKNALKVTRGLMFVMQLPPETDWRYFGQDVTLGDAESAIFWYKPVDSEMYQVIYGDLRIEQVSPEDLPQP